MSLHLETVVVLYRDGNLQLWGVPYRMRESCGQAPRHLQQAGNTRGWIWLGAPGWYGAMIPLERGELDTFLVEHQLLFPSNPYEYVEMPGRACLEPGPHGLRCALAKALHPKNWDASRFLHAAEGLTWEGAK